MESHQQSQISEIKGKLRYKTWVTAGCDGDDHDHDHDGDFHFNFPQSKWLEFKSEQEEEARIKMAESNRHKQYRRFMKTQGPGRMTFEDW